MFSESSHVLAAIRKGNGDCAQLEQSHMFTNHSYVVRTPQVTLQVLKPCAESLECWITWQFMHTV